MAAKIHLRIWILNCQRESAHTRGRDIRKAVLELPCSRLLQPLLASQKLTA